MIGLYIHQHWPYNHPYAARTWTLEDWRGWADGCRRLGYDTFLFWPVLEMMPDPPTPSDVAHLEKLGRVIDMLHGELGMRSYVALGANVVGKPEASRARFEERHYYYCDEMIDPGDPAAVAELMRRREMLLRPLAQADGMTIIDSDPGAYPGSTNQEFVNLLVEHRRLFDRLRPGIELVLWMHAGWRGWCRFYETGRFEFGTPEEYTDQLARLKDADPEPWGVANGLDYAQKLGVAGKVISFNYGRIEGEPSFPMTSFGGDAAYEGGKSPGPRGVMGNAQTHCVQLPNIFAFARGATGQTLTTADYVQFADDLIPGHGQLIVEGWQSLAGTDPGAMRGCAELLERAAAERPAPGLLKGLVFGDPVRFLMDLVLMLRMRAALEDLSAAAEAGQALKAPLAAFADAAEAWQGRHGYQCNWWDPKLHAALRAVDAPAINRVLDITYEVKGPLEPGCRTPAEQVQRNFARMETFTPRLLEAVRTALEQSEQPSAQP